ncbi:hypothetical protein [Anaerocolumna chitinilytica]|uniref:Uncharacterized protein n=1 Tax=Anaerocolumna chitinilytica TaxID=1727145 RepID=A0A7I8DIG0_9FIRM|nr:hypothetical protein [Anaerocolumna chitinilytica]BCJ97134.1 hypothetical protein bsdcttw_01750 [Anaerocolumna chitinilytica]
MKVSKSIDFLLENAGPVIQYRLRKEILCNLKKTEEENLLEQIYQTPNFKLLERYVKPNGYIGSGAHSWDNWRGVILHKTPLQDGEAAARLLSYFAIPKTHPVVANFVAAMRDEEIMRKEFSYIPPEVERYENRFRGIRSGFSLMILVYTMQAMLGYGDDEYVQPFQNVALEAFESILPLSSLNEITKTRQSKGKYNYPYIEEDTSFPGQYHLEALAYTNAWRTPENIVLIANALNHYNAILQGTNLIHVKIGSKYYVPFPLNMSNSPVRPFRSDVIDNITYRRLLTEIAMLGVGESVGVIKDSIAGIEEAIGGDGILKMRFDLPHNKRYSPKNIEYPTPYVDVRLEPDYKRKYALECDLTFWAVQLLCLCGNAEF